MHICTYITLQYPLKSLEFPGILIRDRSGSIHAIHIISRPEFPGIPENFQKSSIFQNFTYLIFYKKNYSLLKKLTCAKFAHGKVTSKDPLCYLLGI